MVRAVGWLDIIHTSERGIPDNNDVADDETARKNFSLFWATISVLGWALSPSLSRKRLAEHLLMGRISTLLVFVRLYDAFDLAAGLSFSCFRFPTTYAANVVKSMQESRQLEREGLKIRVNSMTSFCRSLR